MAHSHIAGMMVAPMEEEKVPQERAAQMMHYENRGPSQIPDN